jgi:hypothetical protein
MERVSDERTAAWRGFLYSHGQLVRRLDTELREAHGMTLRQLELLMFLRTTGVGCGWEISARNCL